MRIGEVSERSGIAVKTIRYYEDIGVLAAPGRSASGYREFDEAVLERLAFIRSAQAIGLTLGEIRGVVALRDEGHTPCGHVFDLLRGRAGEIDRRIRELRALQGELKRLVERARDLDPADCEPRGVCHLVGG